MTINFIKLKYLPAHQSILLPDSAEIQADFLLISLSSMAHFS
ncbi:hypothetical protein RUMLAC_01636 [[Ruminococcus] lactaris ATCC 29176]|uniref:Uncharacterized protein n=1 Tax=[Ruminococcus] lactaris ATCC 29176 TaxID=471875 RepID=B5CQ91_9FIRM|nr:hypothetical protein RUMLAC_01636 [[Ruminococcus] lactaris ATCC 29176]